MQNPQVANPNDFKVVEFNNKTDFDFTPEMGCMFDGRPIFGKTGAPGIKAGESLTVPYHIGHRIATNLAKAAMTRVAPAVDQAGIPTGVPLWDSTRLETLKNSFLTDLYSEERPIAQSETDRLMAKIEEFKKLAEQVLEKTGQSIPSPLATTTPAPEAPQNIAPTVPANDGNVVPDAPNTPPVTDNSPTEFQDKQDVIAELEKRGIKHDKRKSKADLEALLKQ